MKKSFLFISISFQSNFDFIYIYIQNTIHYHFHNSNFHSLSYSNSIKTPQRFYHPNPKPNYPTFYSFKKIIKISINSPS